MLVDPVTTRYTEAFFDLASEKGVVDAVRADVEMIDKIMALGDKLGPDTDTSALERRRDVLSRQVANG